MQRLFIRLTNRLPAALRDRLTATRFAREIDRQARAQPPRASAPLPPQRLLLIASDPRTLVGARGDEAMVSAVVGTLRRANPALRVAVVTGTAEASTAARALGLEPIELWEPFDLLRIGAALRAFAPDAAVLIGADVMDGHYSVPNTLRRIAVAELAARGGARALVTGFSFNDRPAPVLAAALDRLAGRVLLNVRDPISFERLRRFSRTEARLVADVAFLLEPALDAARGAAVLPWIEARRAAGDRVLAVNLHPMLFAADQQPQVDALIDSVARVLMRLAAERPVSWLLLPHDFRGARGDNACLAPLAQRLAAALGPRLLHAEGPWSAAELKAIAGATDAVFTGRMHLAIAALGQGVPVAALTYQGKFHGLWQHFALSTELLMAPAEALDATRLEALLRRLLDDIEPLAQQVRQQLPQVHALAAANLAPLLEGPPT